jgi:hypothetical protein
MKFKDLASGEIFTFWELDKHHTAIKIGERGTCERERAVCLDSGEIVDVHHNKDVKSIERIPEDLELKFRRNGQAFLCSPVNDGNVLARRVILIGGEIMHEKDLRTATAPQAGGDEELKSQVNIILNLWGKKLKELETLGETLRMMIETNLSEDVSNNRIMSTSRIKNLALPTE